MRTIIVILLLLLSLGMHAQGEESLCMLDGIEVEEACNMDIDELAYDNVKPRVIFVSKPTKKPKAAEGHLKNLQIGYRLWTVGGWTALGLCVGYNILFAFAIGVTHGIGGEADSYPVSLSYEQPKEKWSLWKEYKHDLFHKQILYIPTLSSLSVSALCFTMSRVKKAKWKRLKASINATQVEVPVSNGSLGQAPALSLCLTF